MTRKHPFKRHRFPAVIILCAVRMYLRYSLSYQDTADLLAERGVYVDRSTLYRWVRKFGPQIANGIERRRQWVGLNWHVDETYLRVVPAVTLFDLLPCEPAFFS
ncbi:IS6 family transposase [Rhodophyticola sp. CCM32]|nr:IS6 family transposase [Rhodophyticola sp. CCM32]QBY01335.1 IS6 family transposase [Rhodophyticola sp. CCM32]